MSLKASSANCGLCICGAWPLAEVMKKTQRKPEARSQNGNHDQSLVPILASGFWLLASGFLCVSFLRLIRSLLFLNTQKTLVAFGIDADKEGFLFGIQTQIFADVPIRLSVGLGTPQSRLNPIRRVNPVENLLVADPGCRVRLRVGEYELHLQMIGIHQPVALFQTHLLAVRRTKLIDPCGTVETGRRDNECVSLPLACGIPKPPRLRIIGQRPAIGPEVAIYMVSLEELK